MAHVPTSQELKAQARRDEDRAKWPSLYSSNSDRKAYPSWDRPPSGRLAMTITDTTYRAWDGGGVIGRWQDRKGKALEEYLADAMGILAASVVSMKRRLADEAEVERQKAEAAERRRQELLRRERAARRPDFVLRKADDFARYEKLKALSDFLLYGSYRYGGEPADRLIDELRALVESMRRGFEREALSHEIISLSLYATDDI